jgi:hypothetical protein
MNRRSGDQEKRTGGQEIRRMSASGPVRVDISIETRAGPGADFSWSLDLLFMPPDLLLSCKSPGIELAFS